jgi:prepilin-type N-terminal cleavage/methylation domain-containing protein
MFNRHNQKAFTLIELLIVIAIFALIANLTMVSLDKARRETRDAKRMSDISQLRSALHLYSTEKLSYPDGENIALGVDGHLVLDNNGWVDGTAPASPIFMYSIPRDPKMVSTTASSPCTAASTGPCDYGYTLDVNDFTIYFFLEGKIGSQTPGLHTATKDTVL